MKMNMFRKRTFVVPEYENEHETDKVRMLLKE
jgi:hypothetical protein